MVRSSGDRTTILTNHEQPPTMHKRQILIVAWINRNPRTEDLATWLDASLLFMPWAQPALPLAPRLLSWLRSSWTTIRAVRQIRGGTVIVIEPPVFAPLCVWLARRKGSRMFIDLHSGAFVSPKWRWARGVLEFLVQRSDGLVVTNAETLEGVNLGATPAYILHDPIWARPSKSEGAGPESIPSGGSEYVLFPASGNVDEPLDLIEEVGRLLDGTPSIKVTGKIGRENSLGVEYTGFLPQSAYDRLLKGAVAVLSLTDWEATMQRSAYESIQAGVPVVALERRVLRETFEGGGVVFAQSRASDLAEALLYAKEHRAELVDQTEVSRSRMREGSEVVKEILLA
jgi:glycosyltransferase involved in cell wall biosynthesis